MQALSIVKRVLRYALHVCQVNLVVDSAAAAAAAAAINAAALHPVSLSQCMRLEALYMSANKSDLEFDACNYHRANQAPP